MVKRARMELITHEPSRAATFKKRKASIIKKADELSILCGVPVCVIVSDNDAKPEIWPEREQANEILSRFHSLSQTEQTKKMVDREGFVAQRVSKMQIQLQRIEHENRDLEMQILLQNLLSGKGSFADVSSLETATSLIKMVDMKIEELAKMKGSASANHAVQIDQICGSYNADVSLANCSNFESEMEVSANKMVQKYVICESYNAEVSLVNWSNVESEMEVSANKMVQKYVICESYNADVSLANWSNVVESQMEVSANKMVQKDVICESYNSEMEVSTFGCQTMQKDVIFESSNAEVALADWCDVEYDKVSDEVALAYLCDVESDKVEEEMARLFDGVGDCSSYYGFDQEIANILASF